MEPITKEEQLELRALFAEKKCAELQHQIEQMKIEFADLVLRQKYNLSAGDKIDVANGQVIRAQKEEKPNASV